MRLPVPPIHQTRRATACRRIRRNRSPLEDRPMHDADFSQIEFTDRYQAAGVPYPSSDTVCTGQCEGIGCYPQRGDDPTSTPAERTAWEAEHAKVHRIGFRLRAAATWTFLSWRSRLGILLDK